MLKTYIKNSGTSTSFVHNGYKPDSIKETKWYADYDGNNANISINTNNNGKHQDYDITLDKKDLADLLSIPSENMPIHKRLKMDFNPNTFRNNSRQFHIELPKRTSSSKKIKPLKLLKSSKRSSSKRSSSKRSSSKRSSSNSIKSYKRTKTNRQNGSTSNATIKNLFDTFSTSPEKLIDIANKQSKLK